MVAETKEMPSQVGQAVTFLWAGLVFAGFSLFLDFRQTQQVPTPAELIDLFFTFVFWSFLTIKVAHGRNWARITYLIINIIGLPIYLPIVISNFRSNLVLGLVTTASVVIPILGLWLLFTNPGKEWFRNMATD